MSFLSPPLCRQRLGGGCVDLAVGSVDGGAVAGPRATAGPRPYAGLARGAGDGDDCGLGGAPACPHGVEGVRVCRNDREAGGGAVLAQTGQGLGEPLLAVGRFPPGDAVARSSAASSLIGPLRGVFLKPVRRPGLGGAGGSHAGRRTVRSTGRRRDRHRRPRTPAEAEAPSDVRAGAAADEHLRITR